MSGKRDRSARVRREATCVCVCVCVFVCVCVHCVGVYFGLYAEKVFCVLHLCSERESGFANESIERARERETAN